jgi:protein phosphatase inhibitor 2
MKGSPKKATHSQQQQQPSRQVTASLPRRSITWDEEIIAEHDKDRGTRMPIIEPDTPFARSPPVEEIDSSEEPSPKSNHSDHDGVDGDDGRRESFAEDSELLKSRLLLLDQEREDEHEKEKRFKDQRRHHYDEYKKVQEMKKEF